MSHSHASRATPSRRKWFIDLQIRKHERLMINTTNELHLSSSSSANLIPIGFSEQRVSDQITQEDDERLLAKRSWDIALQPIKQLPMNVILAWMAGNSFSLMSIMIVLMLFMKPIQVCFLSRLISSIFFCFKAIFSLGSAFASLEQEGLVGNIWFHKIMYFIGNLSHLALALYKCQSMGLLPTYNSDWIAFADQQKHLETSLGGSVYF